MNITFSEIIELDTDALPKPVPQPEPQQATVRQEPSQENTPGEGFLTPDGNSVIGMWDARRLFWLTFGIDVEQFQSEYGVRFDEALLSRGMIYVDNADTIQVGMRRDTLSNMQYQALVNYLKQDVRQEGNVTILGLWYDPNTFKLLREEPIYQGQVSQFYAMPMGGTDISTTTKEVTPSAVRYQYKGGGIDFTFDSVRFADLSGQLFDEKEIRRRELSKLRKRIKENRENIELLTYDHYDMPVIKYDGCEYAVGTDEMADEAAESGFDEGLFNASFVSNYIDGERVADDYATDDEYYMDQANREWGEFIELEEGQEEPTEAQLEEVAEKFKERHHEEIAGDPMSYLRSMFGEQDLAKELNRYVNEDELVEAAVSADGRGNFLSSYDSDEHSLSDLDLSVLDLPEAVIDALGITYKYKEDLYFYRIN